MLHLSQFENLQHHSTVCLHVLGDVDGFYHATRCGLCRCLMSIRLGFCSIYACTLCHRTTKFDMVTRGGGACILGSATPPISREGVPGLPILGVLLYSCLHPLTQNDQIRHGNTYGEGRVFRRSPQILHKCFVRFISHS